MDLSNIFSLLGGLALFLYGMTMMSNGLEVAAGNRLKLILEKLTANRFVGVGVGAIITAIIQSSSATTVMVIGFVNAGLMTLKSAVWIIMGANIGTTITGQLIALDITKYAPIMAFIGVAMIAFFKLPKFHAYGTILAGLGILFMGMGMMSLAMSPLREIPEFVNLMTKFENPFLGIVAGALFTAIIQSSSASIGILQAFAASGVVTLPSVIFILFGQNIGTCITAVLASLGLDRNAKRATIIHLSFNIIGTILFVVITLLTPFEQWMMAITPNNVLAQIANTHTVFNVVTTLILLPFGAQVANFAYRILPDAPVKESTQILHHLDFNIFNNDYRIGSTTIVNTQLFREIQHMLSLVHQNVQNTFHLMTHYSDNDYQHISDTEEMIDKINKEIIRYTTVALSNELPQNGAEAIGLYLKISSDIERIGDHLMNISEYTKSMSTQQQQFSPDAINELQQMEESIQTILTSLEISDFSEFEGLLPKINQLENRIDSQYEQFGANQLIRLKEKQCSIENSIVYSKILTDFERIGDHSLNIAENFTEIQANILEMRLLHETIS